MGLLDSLLNAAVGNGSHSNTLLATVVGYVTSQPGGVAGFISKLQQGDLGDAVSSWVSTGQNQPVSSDQISGALGAGVLQQLADQSGIGANSIGDQLAKLLPELVNHATPNGVVPDSQPVDLAEQLMSALPSLLSRQA